MSIYKDYDLDDILLDKPCIFEDKLPLYPIKIKDRKEFSKYAMFIIYSAEHYRIDEDEQSLLLIALTNYIGIINGGKYPKDEVTINKLFSIAVNSFIQLFNIVTRGEIILKLATDKETQRYIFVDNNNTPIITDWNFNKIRHTILKQNLMFEPFIYDDPDDEHWANKAKRARAKANKDFGDWEKINIVSCDKLISYESIRDNYNILQLEADYCRIMKNKEVEDIQAWRKVCDEKNAKKLPKVSYSDAIFKQLYKNPEESIWKDADNSDLLKNMGALKK